MSLSVATKFHEISKKLVQKFAAYSHTLIMNNIIHCYMQTFCNSVLLRSHHTTHVIRWYIYIHIFHKK